MIGARFGQVATYPYKPYLSNLLPSKLSNFSNFLLFSLTKNDLCQFGFRKIGQVEMLI